jgi:hypothetical protein
VTSFAKASQVQLLSNDAVHTGTVGDFERVAGCSHAGLVTMREYKMARMIVQQPATSTYACVASKSMRVDFQVIKGEFCMKTFK